MKYTSCRFLENGIHFFFKEIRLCNSLSYGPVLIDNYQGNSIKWSHINEKREQIIKSCKEGVVPECCKGCHCLETKEWEFNPKFKFMEIYHWTHCNCGCVYCSNIYETDGIVDEKIKKSEYYNLLPILEEVVANNLLDPDVEIFVGGGEPAVLEELPDLLELFSKNGIKQINLPTSGVLYSDAIVRAIDAMNTFVTISIDSGSAEVYRKIKRIDAFQTVLDNIKKYMQSPRAVDAITLKYIILDGFNDNIEEIEKWLTTAARIGLKNISLTFEYSHSIIKKKGKEIPKHFYNLFEYVRRRSKELDLRMVEYDAINQMLKRGLY